MSSNKPAHNKSNIVGQKFGHLTIIKELDKRAPGKRVIYQCKCDCGNMTEVVADHLTSGHTKSCGSSFHRIRDLTGQQFGRLTVIQYVGRRNKKTIWKCKCSCGNYIETESYALLSGATKSCGCLNNEVRSKTVNERFGFIDGTTIASISPKRKLNKNNTSGYKGVHFDKSRNKWIAQIQFQRKTHILGRFDTLAEAIKARKDGEEKYFKPYLDK